jgi:AsmA protein
MRLKVPFLRYALAGFAFLLPTAVLAAILPFLINAQPIRAKLLREIGAWAGGGEVKVSGAVSLQHLFSLAVEAHDVEIGQFKGVAPIEGMKAERIVARIDWSDLLLGNFDFNKIQVYGAVIKLRAGSLAELPALYADLASEAGKPFGSLHMSDSRIALRASDRRAYRRIDVASATLRTSKSGRLFAWNGQLAWKGHPLAISVGSAAPGGESAARVPLRAQLASDVITARFDGEAALGSADAEGEVNIHTTSLAEAADWLGLDIGAGRPLIGAATGLSGQITLSREMMALSSGEVSIGGQVAQAALTLKRGDDLPHLEGTLAFRWLDLGAVLAAQGASPTLAASIREPLETDLRLSAKTVTWNAIEAGPLALTLTSRPEQVSAEIAEFGFLTGEVRGHLALDAAAGQTHASARLSADGLDAAALLRLAHQRDWLTGAADVNVEADAVWAEGTDITDRLTARARVNFPEGGQMRLDIPRLATTTSGESDGWGTFDFTNAAFDKLRFEMTLRQGQLNFANVVLGAAGRQMNGRGAIDLAARSLDWRFTFAPGAVAQGRAIAGGPADKPQTSRLSIKGPWIRPVIRSGDAPDSSMLTTPTRAASALELLAPRR